LRFESELSITLLKLQDKEYKAINLTTDSGPCIQTKLLSTRLYFLAAHSEGLKLKSGYTDLAGRDYTTISLLRVNKENY